MVIDQCSRAKLIKLKIKKILLVLVFISLPGTTISVMQKSQHLFFSLTLILPIFGVISALGTLHAQEILTLEKAISIGMENNFSIKIDEKNIEIAESNNNWVNTGKTPTIDLNAGFNNNLTNDNNPASFLQGTYYTGSLNANLTGNWVIYNGGRFKINKQQLEMAVTQQELNQASGIHDLLRDIYQQYYTVIFQQEQLEVLNQVFNLSKDRLRYEVIKKDYGQSNSYNLTQFKASVLTDSVSIVQQLQNIKIAKRNLYQTLDIIGFENYQFRESLEVRPEPINEETLRTALSEENYTLKSLEILASLNRLNTEFAKVSRKPTLSVNGSLGYARNGFKFFADDPNTGDPFKFLQSNRFTGSANLVLNYNLYDGGRQKNDIKVAQLQEEVDQLSILETKANLTNQLDILLDNYQNQIQLLALTDSQIEIARQNIQLTEERFKAGQLTSLDFRNVQIQYLNAAFNKISAIYELLLSRNEIDWLVGRYEG